MMDDRLRLELDRRRNRPAGRGSDSPRPEIETGMGSPGDRGILEMITLDVLGRRLERRPDAQRHAAVARRPWSREEVVAEDGVMNSTKMLLQRPLDIMFCGAAWTAQAGPCRSIIVPIRALEHEDHDDRSAGHEEWDKIAWAPKPAQQPPPPRLRRRGPRPRARLRPPNPVLEAGARGGSVPPPPGHCGVTTGLRGSERHRSTSQ